MFHKFLEIVCYISKGCYNHWYHRYLLKTPNSLNFPLDILIFFNFVLLFIIYSLVSRDGNISNYCRRLNLINNGNIGPSCFDGLITLKVHVPKKLMCGIFRDCFLPVLVPLIRPLKHKLLKKSPMSYFCEIIVSPPIIRLRQLVAPANYMTHSFSSFSI